MSDAYKCDRCDELYEGDVPNIVDLDNTKDGMPVVGDQHVANREYELCGSCGLLVEAVLEGDVKVKTDDE